MRGLFLVLKKLGLPKNVIWHSIDVYEISKFIGKRLRGRGYRIDLDLVEKGAALHDVGRVRSSGLDHGLIGGEILRKMGYDDGVVRICERHVLAGIKKEEFERFGIKGWDAVPETIEEKIVCYADKLSDSGKIRRIRKYIGEDSPLYKRVLEFLAEMEGLVGTIKKIKEFNVGFVGKKNDDILLLRRKDSRLWEIPGGKVEWGENLEEAVRRECKEECGVDVDIEGMLGSSSAIYEKSGKLKHSVYVVFSGKVFGEVRLGGEHDSWKWVSYEEIGRMELCYNTERILDGF